MKNRYHKWLTDEISIWEEKDLIDTETKVKLTAYYSTQEETVPNRMGAVLGILGSILIGLGIILILAKNWGFFPRGAKITLSFLPFLTGSFAGMIVLKKRLMGWLREACAVFTAIGIAAAIVMSGQVYHIIAEEWILYFIAAVLSLPLIYLYDSVLALAAYLILGGICMFTTDLTPLWIKVILGLVIIGAGMPYGAKCHDKSKQSIETVWAGIFLGAASFLFITSLEDQGILLRELYIGYFILLLGIDAFFYEDGAAISRRPFGLLGHIGIYITLFIFTFKGFWYDIATQVIRFDHTMITVILLGIDVAITVRLIKQKKAFNKRLHVYLGAAIILSAFRMFGFLNRDTSAATAIAMSFLFGYLALSILKEGLESSSMMRMNSGLVLLAAVIITRFFDGEFSFLVKGIVFIISGAAFLLANFYVIKKRQKEMGHV